MIIFEDIWVGRGIGLCLMIVGFIAILASPLKGLSQYAKKGTGQDAAQGIVDWGKSGLWYIGIGFFMLIFSLTWVPTLFTPHFCLVVAAVYGMFWFANNIDKPQIAKYLNHEERVYNGDQIYDARSLFATHPVSIDEWVTILDSTFSKPISDMELQKLATNILMDDYGARALAKTQYYSYLREFFENSNSPYYSPKFLKDYRTITSSPDQPN